VAEGLSASEVSREAQRHRAEFEETRTQPAEPGADSPEAVPAREDSPLERRHRAIHVAEAALLAVVTIVTAWAGFAAAKWSTKSRVQLAQASTLRAQASRAELSAIELRNFDSSTFQAWFSAYLQNNTIGQQIAIRRFRPIFRVAFDAWWATNPQTNVNAPPGPTYMPEYKQPELDKANAIDASADRTFAAGERSGGYADEYVRITVILAAVLFLIGIGSTFRAVGIRYALVTVGLVLLAFAVVLIAQQPAPPA
jgi:hypothetical protein